MHLQPLGRNRHIVPVMHVLKTDVPNIVIGQFPDFLGHPALQDAGQPFIDLLPIEWDGLGGDTQELRESSDYLILLSRIDILQPEAASRLVPRRRGVPEIRSSESTSFWQRSFAAITPLRMKRLGPSWRVVERKGRLLQQTTSLAESVAGLSVTVSFLLVGPFPSRLSCFLSPICALRGRQIRRTLFAPRLARLHEHLPQNL
jgi:hypothetical protein